MKAAGEILRFLIAAAGRGERTALVTITGVVGTSSRKSGTHMAVSETGKYLGSFSGGCVEAAVVGEALRIINTGHPEAIRFGVGSPFIDIRLPCGGGLDLLFFPDPPSTVLDQACDLLAQRRPVFLALGRDGRLSASTAQSSERTGWKFDTFCVRHDPDLRVIIIGHGAETEALAAQAAVYGAVPVVLSPDADLVDRIVSKDISAHCLKTPARSPHLVSDTYSAVVMLFHDHDWERELLVQALDGEAFFVGAMGSRRTHARRLDELRNLGASPSALARLRGSIGLIPATRDPQTLALSALSEIVACYQARLETSAVM